MTRTLRALAVVPLLTVTVLAGLVFTTQTASHAFAGPRVPVTLPPSIATPLTTTVLPAAGTAGAAIVGTAAAGLVVGGAIGTAAVCLFSNLPCSLPGWGQSPDVPPNNDQPATGGTGGWVYSVGPYAGQRGYVAGSPSHTDSTEVRAGFTTDAAPGTFDDVKWQIECRGGGQYAGQGRYDNGPGNWTLGVHTCSAGVDRVAVQIDRLTSFYGSSVGATWGVWYPVGNPLRPPDGTEVPDPTRYAQAWRECGTLSTSAPEFLKAVGDAVAYRESQAAGARPEMPVPVCPASHPVPYRYGVGTTTGTPLSPGSYPQTQPMPDTTRGVPPVSFPTTYPDCPFPDSCTVGRPTPGAPLKPLPSPPNPDGSPATNPDGTSKTEPVPTPAPGDLPCAWGPYVVPESNCADLPDGGVGAPQPEPSHDTTTGADPAPTPQTDPEGCLSRSVSWNPVTWVLAPVKCALQWAFVPRAEVVTADMQALSDTWQASAPGAYLGATGALVGKVGTLGANAEGCGGPSINLNTGLLRGTYKPLDACPGSLAENAARAVRVIFLVGLYLGAAALGARILAASFGLNLPGFGRGGED